MRIVFIALLLSIVCGTHEMGHYAAMRTVGVEVEEVAVGFGPRLVGFKDSRGTTFSLRMLPLGGFTKTVEDDKAGSLKNVSDTDLLLIDFGGMLANVAMGFFLFLLVFWRSRIIPSVMPERIHQLFWPWDAVAAAFLASFGGWVTMPWTIIRGLAKRDRKKFLATVTGPIGMFAPGNRSDAPPPEPSLFGGAEDMREESVGLKFLWVIAIFSVAIAGFNLLPILPLDGGQAVAIAVGWLGETALTVYAAVSEVAFWLFILAITWSDIKHLFKKKQP